MENNAESNKEKYSKLKSLSSLFLKPIPQPQALALVPLNHFVVRMRKCDKVLRDAPPSQL